MDCLRPELFPPALEREIRALVCTSIDHPSHRVFGRHKTAGLAATLAVLHDDPRWIEEPVANLAHHSSATRSMVSVQLALAAPVLASDDADLGRAVSENFEAWHFGSAMTLALFAAARGSERSKRDRIERWRTTVDPDAPDARHLGQLHASGFMSNPFATWMIRLQQYVTLRVLGAWSDAPVQTELTLVPPCRATVRESPTLATLWSRMERHPLARAMVEVERDVSSSSQ